MTTIVRVAAFVLACASTVRSTASSPLRSPTKITGNDVKGNFQFLGAFCLPDKSSLLTFEIVTQEEAPSDLEILFYDDEPSSFNNISRNAFSPDAASYCETNSKVSKSFTNCKPGNRCSHGLGVKEMRHRVFRADSPSCPGCHSYRYTQRVQVIDKLPEIWYFLAAQCESPDINIVSYRFTSDYAQDCNAVRTKRYEHMPHALADSRLPGNQRVKKFGAGVVDAFVPLGTLCFRKTRDDTSARVAVSFKHQPKAEGSAHQHRADGVELLVYRKGVLQTLFSHDGGVVDKAASRAECERRKDMAEAVMTVSPDSVASKPLAIPTRQQSWDVAVWELVFVLHQGCDSKAKVRVSSFTIEAPDAVPCPTTPDKTVLYVDPPADPRNTFVTYALTVEISDRGVSYNSNVVVYASAMVLAAIVGAF